MTKKGFCAVSILLYSGIVWLNVGWHYRYSPYKGEPHLFYLPGWCFAGFKNVVADLHWFCCSRNQSYYSSEYLYKYADAITNLDPHFNVVYRACAVSLALKKDKPRLGLALLRKSISSPFNSDDWRIYFYCAYYHYFFFRDKRQAYQNLEYACKQPVSCVALLKKERTAPAPFLTQWAQDLRLSNHS